MEGGVTHRLHYHCGEQKWVPFEACACGVGDVLVIDAGRGELDWNHVIYS